MRTISDNPKLSDAVAVILAEVDADIAARRPVCRSSGRCCRFEEYGHRMYVTGVEVEHFVRVHVRGKDERQKTKDEKEGPRGRVSLPLFFARESPEGCPYQVNNLCTAREARPLGCRVYFCDENAQGWQNDVYEKYHAKLKALHEEFGVPYRYMEWREALRELTSKSEAGF